MAKSGTTESLINTVNEIAITAKNRGITHLYTEDAFLDGRIITLNNRRLVNFGSCSYLGLETDPRLKESAIDAVKRFGTQFSSSRTYTSCGNYLELEELIGKMFNKPVLLSTSSSQGHQSVMPIVINGNDAVIYDQQAHISMQELTYKISHNGSPITILRHSRLDELENKIEQLQIKHEKVWYVIDGVYSMYGDFAPIHKLMKLMDKYKKLHLYIDDAHGMSWRGLNGTGYTLSEIDLHPRMVLATSLAKGFGSCGGVFIFPNEALRDRVKNWGGPITFSGPQQPGTVGASIASAKIHLSDEITSLQKNLKQNIDFCNYIFDQHKLPLVANNDAPIFFVGLGITRMGYNMIGRLMDDGFYTNIGIFPAVPETCTGIRFTITNHHTHEDIEQLAKSIAHHLPKAMQDEGRTYKDIQRAFRKVTQHELKFPEQIHAQEKEELKVEMFTSIQQIGENIWNRYLDDKGAFNYEGLSLLEQIFSNNDKEADNWKFLYVIIRDMGGEVILMTFFTDCIIKDDMMAPEYVSEKIEQKRKEEPDFLTSRQIMMGSMLTNGEHLYLNRNKNWKPAVIKMLDLIWAEQDKREAQSVFLRDFDAIDKELADFLTDQGFVRVEMPTDNRMENLTAVDMDEFIEKTLNSSKRKKLKKEVLPYLDEFEVSIDAEECHNLDEIYALYLNVKKKNLGLNTFDLPVKFFKMTCESKYWEVVRLKYKNTGKLVAVVFSFIADNSYCPVIMGLDRDFMNFNIYKQAIYQVIKRAVLLKKKRLFMGLTATETKRNFGASQHETLGFIQLKDHYNFELIECMKFEGAG